MSNTSRERAHDVILDSIADGVFTVDRDWNITSFNRAAERITGVPCNEAIGQKCRQGRHHAEPEQTRDEDDLLTTAAAPQALLCH